MSSGGLDSAITSPTTYDDDELMTKQHKELLAAHRDELVANMYPDDILNRLQSRKVLNARDVTRIKDKTQIEGQVELLLDTLMRKPDRAFNELINALEDTDQKHVAKLLVKGAFADENIKSLNVKSSAGIRVAKDNRDDDNDDKFNEDDSVEVVNDEELDIIHGPSHILPSNRRKRKVQVAISATDVDPETSSSDGVTAKRKSRVSSAGQKDQEMQLVKQINRELLESTLAEVRNLREVVKAGTDQRNLERRKILLNSIKLLTRYRREIVDVYEGSVILCILCPSMRALNNLWVLCANGELQTALRSDFVTDVMMAKYRLKSFDISVSFSEDDYQRCQQDIMSDGCAFHKPLYDELLQAQFTPPFLPQTTSHKSSVSPDSGISSQPSPVSPPISGTFEPQHVMVLRSRRHASSAAVRKRTERNSFTSS